MDCEILCIEGEKDRKRYLKVGFGEYQHLRNYISKRKSEDSGGVHFHSELIAESILCLQPE